MYYIIEIAKDYNGRKRWTGRNYTLHNIEYLLTEIIRGVDYYDYYVCRYSVTDYIHDYCKNFSRLKMDMLLSFDEFWEVLN